jgi:hypothetical protein
LVERTKADRNCFGRHESETICRRINIVEKGRKEGRKETDVDRRLPFAFWSFKIFLPIAGL